LLEVTALRPPDAPAGWSLPAGVWPSGGQAFMPVCETTLGGQSADQVVALPFPRPASFHSHSALEFPTSSRGLHLSLPDILRNLGVILAWNF
jgi:hypothetical protein